MLIYEKSREGRALSLLPACDVPEYSFGEKDLREKPLRLPQMGEVDVTRHYAELAKKRTESMTDFIRWAPAL